MKIVDARPNYDICKNIPQQADTEAPCRSPIAHPAFAKQDRGNLRQGAWQRPAEGSFSIAWETSAAAWPSKTSACPAVAEQN